MWPGADVIAVNAPRVHGCHSANDVTAGRYVLQSYIVYTIS